MVARSVAAGLRDIVLCNGPLNARNLASCFSPISTGGPVVAVGASESGCIVNGFFACLVTFLIFLVLPARTAADHRSHLRDRVQQQKREIWVFLYPVESCGFSLRGPLRTPSLPITRFC